MRCQILVCEVPSETQRGVSQQTDHTVTLKYLLYNTKNIINLAIGDGFTRRPSFGFISLALALAISKQRQTTSSLKHKTNNTTL